MKNEWLSLVRSEYLKLEFKILRWIFKNIYIESMTKWHESMDHALNEPKPSHKFLLSLRLVVVMCSVMYYSCLTFLLLDKQRDNNRKALKLFWTLTVILFILRKDKNSQEVDDMTESILKIKKGLCFLFWTFLRLNQLSLKP